MNDKKMHCWLHQYFFTWSFCIPYFVIHAFSLIYQIHPSACFVGVCQYVGWIINFLCIKLHRKSSLKFYRREREGLWKKLQWNFPFQNRFTSGPRQIFASIDEKSRNFRLFFVAIKDLTKTETGQIAFFRRK